MGELREIHMGREIGFARFVSGSTKLCRLTRLQGVARSRTPISVIDDQRRPARRARGALRYRRSAPSNGRWSSRISPGFGGGAGTRLGLRVQSENECVVLDADKPLAPSALRRDELADGQRVEELVGDEQQRAVGHIGEARRAR